MCKLLITKGLLHREQVERLLARAAKTFGASQPDGFGFVALGADGSIARGRYLKPSSFGGFRRKLPAWVASGSIESGKMPAEVVALIAHGRTSTNHVNVGNVHPFKSGPVFLAHNGILSWKGDGREPHSSGGCDSDSFLTWLTSTPDSWSKTKADWAGYGVLGILDSETDKLIVAKCATGSLSWTGSGKLHVFSTVSADCASFARAIGLKARPPLPVTGGVRIEFDCHSESVEMHNWEGFGARAWDSMSARTTQWDSAPSRYQYIPPEKRERVDLFPDYEPRKVILPDAIVPSKA